MPREEKNNPKEYLFEQEGCYIMELSNTSSDPESSIAKARVPVGVTTAWHRLINVTEGTVLYRVQVALKLAMNYRKK